FFSSRRRHTRSLRDWSSDVCSSDLQGDTDERDEAERKRRRQRLARQAGQHIADGAGGGERHAEPSRGADRRMDRLAVKRQHHGRSEERRVGKECRSWGGSETYIRNT